MPGLDHALDPITGDWMPDGKGGFLTTEGNESAVHHALSDKRGWPGDEKAGSKVRDLAKMTAPQAAAEAPNLIRGALQPLIDDGLLRDVIITVERDRSRVFIRTEIIDAAGARVDVTHLTPFGE